MTMMTSLQHGSSPPYYLNSFGPTGESLRSTHELFIAIEAGEIEQPSLRLPNSIEHEASGSSKGRIPAPVRSTGTPKRKALVPVEQPACDTTVGIQSLHQVASAESNLRGRAVPSKHGASSWDLCHPFV